MNDHWRVYNMPGEFHYRDLYLNRAGNERAARAQLRSDLNMKRLPTGLTFLPGGLK